MAKIKNVKTISSKDIALKRLKLLTKYLFNNDDYILNKLLSITEKDEYSSLIYRLYSYLANYPRLAFYLNQYLNYLYMNIDKNNVQHFLDTFVQILKAYGIRSSNQLHYAKYKTIERIEFHDILKEYYDILNIPLSSNDITSLYLLYNRGIISSDNFNQIKTIVEGKERKTHEEIVIEQFISIDEKEDIKYSKEHTQNIKNFIDTIKSYIQNRQICKNCPMYHRGAVILDTNAKNLGQIDLALIGLNPGKNELEQDKPFVGKSGQLLRKYLDPLVKKYNLTYLIANIILCYSDNSSDIPNINAIANNCKSLTDQIHKEFPSKLKIILGSDAMNLLGIKGGITRNVNKMINHLFIMFHPSYILRSPNKLKYFEQGFINLDSLINTILSSSSRKETNLDLMDENSINVPKEKIVTKFSHDLTLFDIQIIGEQVIYILLNQNGEKRYLIENIQFPVYLKSGAYGNCNYIDDKMDAIVYLNAAERESLNQKLYHNIRTNTQKA